MKLSIIVPVYYNEDNLIPLYDDIKAKILDVIDYEYEIVMVNDGSKDRSYEVMQQLAAKDPNIRICSLSRNFGSHAACLCGLSICTGDCAVIKAADLQEPSELILDMVESWKQGNNVVLACREDRKESLSQKAFAKTYYWLVRKTALSNMPKDGFDIYLVDRKVIEVLKSLDETNSSITCQILWSGFRTGTVPYVRREREIGKSRWTLKKKIRLVTDTLFSFSTVPIKLVSTIGALSITGSVIWGIIILISWLNDKINVSGWTASILFSLFSFGITMLSIGIIGEYVWRIFDSSRGRPPFIIEERPGEKEEKRE